MTNLCRFIRREPFDVSYWQCDQCGHVTPIRFTKAPKRYCPTPERSGLAKLDERLPTKTADHYLKCTYRSQQAIATITGRVAGCGCSGSTVEVYQCSHFHEPVIKQGHPPCLDTLKEKVPGATGRTCRECKVPMQEAVAPIEETKQSSYRLQEIQVSQSLDRGIVTGASQVHWPCLGALAIAAAQQGIGFAVADHGLRPWQRDELNRVGARWVDHEKPSLDIAVQKLKIYSDIKAWWKPFICLASPFQTSVWIDSDAVVTGSLSDVLNSAERSMQISTQRLWQGQSVKLYSKPVGVLFGRNAVETVLPKFADINSGVLAWTRGEPIIDDWERWCIRLFSDQELVKYCMVRDQAGLVVALVNRAIQWVGTGEQLGDSYNVPADYLPSRHSPKRKAISLESAAMLEQAKQRHPGAIVVHWLGGVKPWKL